MMPTGVLRMWGLGLLSWALLGLGAYLANWTYHEFSRPHSIRSIVENDPNVLREPRDGLGDLDARDFDAVRERDQPASLEAPVHADERWFRWLLLASTIACFGMSLVGYWPISLFMGKAHSSTSFSRSRIEPQSSQVIARPDGTRLYYEVYGDAHRPTLIFTHGWSLNRSAWDYLKADLSPHYRLVMWDLPGMGKSYGPENRDYSLEKMAQDLDAVIDASESERPIVLVGHSIGGMITQTFCRLYPERLGAKVAGLALFHTTYRNPLTTMVASGLLTTLQAPVIVPLHYLTIAVSPIAWLSNWLSYLNGSLHITTRLTSFAGEQTRQQVDHGARLAAAARPANVARGNLAMLRFDEELTLPHVTVPVLVLGGENDLVTQPRASQHIEDLLPHDKRSRNPGNHLGYWEYSKLASSELREFVDQVATTISAPVHAGVAVD